MKILLAGDWHSPIYEEPLFRGFQACGSNVEKFTWNQYFKKGGGDSFFGKISTISAKAQNKYLFGPIMQNLNNDLICRAKTIRPDVLFVFRGSHIHRQTLQEIKHAVKGIRIIGYNNDDPFSPKYPKWVWRIFKDAIPEYDLMYAYRHHNVPEFLQAGAKYSKILRSWYVPEYNHPIDLTPAQVKDYGSDVVFIGHYEEDGRLPYIERLLEGPFHFRLYGTNWEMASEKSTVLRSVGTIFPLRGDSYNIAINASKIALCFLSKLNRDTYTRRCFEIPASGTVMLAEYTDDLASLFEPDKEACYFHSPDEMMMKISQLLKDQALRMKINDAARNRLKKDGHDARTRARDVLLDLKSLI
jgi:spore maturation protein CgeB